MSEDQVRLIALTETPDYVVLYDDSIVTYVDISAEAKTQFGVATAIMGEVADYLYIGFTAKEYMFGYRYAVAATYGAATWEYWDGLAWSAFTPNHDSTVNFSQHGWVQWQAADLVGWATTDQGGDLPAVVYWIRVTIASVTVIGTFYNFMLNTDLNGPLIINDEDLNIKRNYRDINGTLQESDLVYTGPSKAIIECSQVATSMEQMILIYHFRRKNIRLQIYDYAQTAVTPDPDLDAFYLTWSGLMTASPRKTSSPQKMDCEAWILEFDIDEVVAITD